MKRNMLFSKLKIQIILVILRFFLFVVNLQWSLEGCRLFNPQSPISFPVLQLTITSYTIVAMANFFTNQLCNTPFYQKVFLFFFYLRFNLLSRNTYFLDSIFLSFQLIIFRYLFGQLTKVGIISFHKKISIK